jgi:tripartite-type tricarboxylate transporter receptor subunit TctC
MTDPSERMAPSHAMRQILAALALLLWFAPLQGSQAQDFPNKPVHFIVPYAAGGSGDLLARLLGDKLSKLWGQQVVVDNKPGAGGLIGTEAGAHADPDGYTIYLATDGPLTIAATLHRKVPYDWKRDFAPISMMAVGYQILLSSPKLPAANLKEFVALAQQNPGKYNFASIGIGSAPHLAAELFLSLAGLKLTHVPYRGSSQQSIAALIAGDVQMFVVGTSTAVPFVKAGTVHGLAVTAPKRLDSLPEVPTFTEAGYPAMDYSLWFAVLAPATTPPAIVQKLHDDIARVVADPDYVPQLATRGFEAQSNTPAELEAFLQKDYEKFQVLIEKLGLKVD